MENIAGKLNPTDLLVAYDHVERLNGRTPLIYFGTIHKYGYQVDLWVKMDVLLPGGSFKDRGSEWFVHQGVSGGILKEGDYIVTASAGNHAKGVAKAARGHNLKAVIYMSKKTPAQKVGGTRRLGANVVPVEGDYHDAAKVATQFSEENGYVYCPAYEHPDVIIGQSTVTTESLIQLYVQGIRPDFFVYPFGGGGLANGGGFAARHFDSIGYFSVPDYGNHIHNFGVQAENFDSMTRSYQARSLLPHIERGDTIADGIKVRHASQGMLELSLKTLDGMFAVTEAQIRDAIRTVYHSELLKRLKGLPIEELRKKYRFHHNHTDRVSDMNILEGAAAAAFACAFDENMLPYEQIARQIHPRRTIVGVVIASGNNIDRRLLEEILSEK